MATGLLPDSLAYLAFSHQLLESGGLVLEGWGHVDSGLILPPLYPALVALWGAVSGDPMAAAYAVSSAALLLAIVPLALAGARLGGALAALLALLVAGLHPFFVQYGTLALTEALFVLVLAVGVCAATSFARQPTGWRALGLGALAGALFLTRSIGGFFWPAAAFLALVCTPRAPQRAWPLMLALLVTAGFAAIAGPYALALHAQSGAWPDVQVFRLHRYEVHGAAEASHLDASAGYDALYADRRAQRRLTPDGAEMVGALLPAGDMPAPPAPGIVARFFGNLRGNLASLAHSLGTPAFVLLLLALATPAWKRGAGPERWVLPIVMTAYVGALSLVAGVVPRYLDVLVPFAFLAVLAESARLARAIGKPAWLPLAAPLAVAVLCAATLPTTFRSLPLSPRVGERDNPLAACKAQLPPATPVFAFHPTGAYLLGGTFRIVPNDALPATLAYARNTGVRYLLLMEIPADLAERAYYERAPWARDPSRLAAAGAVPACRTADGVATLYRLPGSPG